MNGNKKMFYKMMKNKKRTTESAKKMEAEDGEIIEQEGAIKELWKNYFERLLNSNDDQENEKVNLGEIRLMEMKEISWIEVENALKKMKSNKSAGPDELTTDMIKVLGPVGIHWVTRLFKCIWQNGKVPDDWGRGEIITLFKKGSKRQCKNYRGITLTSQIAKIFEKILLNRVGDKIEEELSEEQHGFRRGRSTVDLIFALRQVVEKYWEYNKKLIVVFLDIEKAYDSVKRSVIWESLRQIGVDETIINWIKELYRVHECRVRTTVGHTDWFSINQGLKQGSVLSPVLFNVVMEVMIRKIREGNGGNIKTMIFADDIMIWGHNHYEVQNQLNRWNALMKERGLKISAEKSEVIVVGRDSDLENEITLDNVKLKKVDGFKYLGSWITNDGKLDQEISARLESGARFYQSVKHLVWNRDVPKKAKVTMFKTYYVPITTYAGETWRLTERQWSRLQAGEMRFLRAIKGKTRRDKIRNEEIRENIVDESLRQRVEKSRLKWYGHVKRMEEGRLPKVMEELAITGKRPRGRPRRRWIDDIKKDVTRRGYRFENIQQEEVWKDRKKWRGLVYTQTRH